jgi:cell division inhibitor SepF
VGSLRRTSAWLGLAEDSVDDFDPEYDDYPDADPPGRAGQSRRRPSTGMRAAGGRAGRGAPAPLDDDAEDAEAQGYQIATIHARGFRDARIIGEYYRQDIPVVIDLSGLEDPDARRIVDFAAGLIFGRRGDIHRLARGVFLLSPIGTSILAADGTHPPTGDFFDQS